MNINALTEEERSYLLGLYFADGSLIRRGNSYQVTYKLQWNEKELADRVASILRRARLIPRIYKYGNLSLISVYCVNLNGFFPNKEKVLLSDGDARRGFFKQNNILHDSVNCVAFCAGLLDGDGSCKIHLEKRSETKEKKESSNLGGLEVKWEFTQIRYPFLLDFFRKFVDSVAPRKSSGLIRRKGLVEGLRINRSGREALLRVGFAAWSWKAREFVESYSQLLEERSRVRTERLKKAVGEGTTLVDVAKMLGVSRKTLFDQFRCGKLRATLVHEGRGQRFVVIPKDEVENLRKKYFRGKEEEEAEIERIVGEGVKFQDVAEMLRIPPSTLHMWYKDGKFRATLVHKLRGRVHKLLVVPRDEVECLKLEIHSMKGKVTVFSSGKM